MDKAKLTGTIIGILIHCVVAYFVYQFATKLNAVADVILNNPFLNP